MQGPGKCCDDGAVHQSGLISLTVRAKSGLERKKEQMNDIFRDFVAAVFSQDDYYSVLTKADAFALAGDRHQKRGQTE